MASNDRKGNQRRKSTGTTAGLHLAAATPAVTDAIAAPGWYPDPDDTGGLRFFDGRDWSEHRARLHMPTPSAPAAVTQPAAALCACGVVAIGRCRVCADPYCSAHISSTPVDDKPFRKRWEAWTCGNCIEDAQREIRALQLARCENVSMQMQRVRRLANVKTPNGRRPPLVNLFQHPRSPTERPPRYAEAYLIEYDGGPPDPSFTGLALSTDGSTVFNIGLPVAGVAKDRLGPKRTLTGYVVKNVIDVDLLVDAAARDTTDPWFEFAARSFLRTAHHIGIKPDFTIVFEPLPAEAPDAELPPPDPHHALPAPDPTTFVAPVETPAESAIEDADVIHDVTHIEVESASSDVDDALPVRQPDPPESPPLPLPHP